MKTSTKQAVDEFVQLVGGESWVKMSQPCTGKWGGTTDHGIIIDGKHRLFVSNGMTYFEETVREWISQIKTFREKKEEYLQIIRQQAELDNRKALEEGLETVTVLDIGILSPESAYDIDFFKPYVLLEVGKQQIRFVESSLAYALKEDRLDRWLEKLPKNVYTAGAVVDPDFIFGNVRFNSTDGMYRIIINQLL